MKTLKTTLQFKNAILKIKKAREWKVEEVRKALGEMTTTMYRNIMQGENLAIDTKRRLRNEIEKLLEKNIV